MNILEREISARKRAFIPFNGKSHGLGLPTNTALTAGRAKPNVPTVNQGIP